MTFTFGNLTVALGRFTKCVSPANYRNPGKLGADFGPGGLGKDACDYLLGRKLVCLGGVECAVGSIVHIEPVGYQKPFPEDIDNDFCINLLLFPHELDEFTSTDELDNWHQVTSDGVQGRLILHDPLALPEPNEPHEPLSEPTPYTRTYLFGDGPPRSYEANSDDATRAAEEAAQDERGIERRPIPVLHCEFEGSRIFMVCKALEPFLDLLTGGPGAGACRNTIGRIPVIGGWVCTVIEFIVLILLLPLLLPLMAAAAAAAWAASAAIDEAFVTGPIARRVSLGDDVIVTGRWVWDGGHSGWNELHATHTLQQVRLPGGSGIDAATAAAFVERWCRLTMAAPPPFDNAGIASVPLPLTAAEQETYDRQRRPEHSWLLHPAVDGCVPAEQPPDGPPVIR